MRERPLTRPLMEAGTEQGLIALVSLVVAKRQAVMMADLALATLLQAERPMLAITWMQQCLSCKHRHHP